MGNPTKTVLVAAIRDIRHRTFQLWEEEFARRDSGEPPRSTSNILLARESSRPTAGLTPPPTSRLEDGVDHRLHSPSREALDEVLW